MRHRVLRSAAVLGGIAAAACGSRSAQIESSPSGTGRFVPVVAHDVLAAYQLEVDPARLPGQAGRVPGALEGGEGGGE